LTPADLLTLADNEVIIFTGNTKPVHCARFTHETFPAPQGYAPPEREPIPVSALFTRQKELHRKKLEAYRRLKQTHEAATEQSAACGAMTGQEDRQRQLTPPAPPLNSSVVLEECNQGLVAQQDDLEEEPERVSEAAIEPDEDEPENQDYGFFVP